MSFPHTARECSHLSSRRALSATTAIAWVCQLSLPTSLGQGFLRKTRPPRRSHPRGRHSIAIRPVAVARVYPRPTSVIGILYLGIVPTQLIDLAQASVATIF